MLEGKEAIFCDSKGQWVFLDFSLHYVSFEKVIALTCQQLEDHWEITFQYKDLQTIISLSKKENVEYLLSRFAAHKSGSAIEGIPIIERE
jgi:hypothetical protein